MENTMAVNYSEIDKADRLRKLWDRLGAIIADLQDIDEQDIADLARPFEAALIARQSECAKADPANHAEYNGGAL
jgi:hypothetical protein